MSGGEMKRWRRLLAVAAVTMLAAGCNRVADVPTSTAAATQPPVTATTQPDSCPEYLSNAAGGSAVDVTLRQRYEDLIDMAELEICIQILGDDGLAYRNRFPLPSPERAYNPVKLDVIQLPAGEYTMGAVLGAGGRSCTTQLDLTDGVAMIATALVWSGCLLQVEETAGWSGGELGTPIPQEYFGPAHCGWAGTTFMVMDSDAIRGMFVRQPDGGFPREYFLSTAYRAELGLDDYGMVEGNPDGFPADAVLTLDLDAILPDDAVDLGYVRGKRRLDASPTDSTDYLYVVTSDAVERWPRLRPEVGCM